MQFRRNSLKNLCNGPGRLCRAMGITREQNGIDLCGAELYIADNDAEVKIVASPRIGIDYAGEWKDKLLRFYVEGNEYVSHKQQPILHWASNAKSAQRACMLLRLFSPKAFVSFSSLTLEMHKQIRISRIRLNSHKLPVSVKQKPSIIHIFPDGFFIV